MTEQVFFFFFLSMVTVPDLNKIMKFLKLGEYFYVKEENFDRKYVSWKKYWLYYMIFLLYRLEKWCVFKKKPVKTQIFPLINFIDTVRDIYFAWVHICSPKILFVKLHFVWFRINQSFLKRNEQWSMLTCHYFNTALAKS